MPFPAITATLVELSDLVTPIETLSLSRARSWRDELNEAGSGELTLQNDDPALPSFALPNSLVNFYLAGVLSFTLLLESFFATDIDQLEEAAETTVFKGRGHLALLDRILVYPGLGVGKKPIEEDRAFNWTARAYDDSTWVPATLVTTVGDAKTNWDGGDPDVQWDPDFPDDTAEILWASDGTVSAAGVGDCYFRQFVTIPYDGTYALIAAMDNYGEVYPDGVLVVTPGQSESLEVGFKSRSQVTLEFTAGSHLIACKCTNAIGVASNPAGQAWAIYEIDALGKLGSLIAHSEAASTVMVEYASEPPGMSPGQAIILAVAEGQARGCLPDLAYSFDEVLDTNGDPWPIVADIATKVGTTLLQFLRELSGTYIDFAMAPGTLTLDAYIRGGLGGTPGVNYHSPTDPNDPATGSLLQLTRTGEA